MEQQQKYHLHISPISSSAPKRLFGNCFLDCRLPSVVPKIKPLTVDESISLPFNFRLFSNLAKSTRKSRMQSVDGSRENKYAYTALHVFLVAVLTTSLASQDEGDSSKLKEKSLLSRDTQLTDNLGEENEGESGSLAQPSLVNTKWTSHLPPVLKIKRDDVPFNTGHQLKPSLLTSGFQRHPFETIPDHFNVITPGSFHNRAPVLDRFHSEGGHPFSGPVNRPPGGPFAEERQFRPARPQQRPQRGPPRNLRGPVFTQDNPALAPPPPRLTQSNFNPPIPTHPDISLIPLQSTGDSGVNDLLEERFPPFNDPVLPSQLTAVKKNPTTTTAQPLPLFITQDEPLPLSHQNQGELTQQAPSPQLLEPQRFQPRQNATTRPRHLGSLFPQSQQRLTPTPQPPTTTRNPTSFIRHSPQPTLVDTSQLQPSIDDIAQPNSLSLNPSQPFVDVPPSQFPFNDFSRPSFEKIPQLVPPPQFPPQELNHISQEPSLPLTKPTVFQPNGQKTRPEFQQNLQLRDPQKPINQQSPLETFQQQNQPFVPSSPLPSPPQPQGNPTVQPFQFQFQRPQRPARGPPNFRPPPPTRGRRRPLIPVRIRDPRRPRQLTTSSAPRNSASRRPRSEGPFQAREHSPVGPPQPGLISPFASVWAALQHVFEPPRRTTHAARGRRLRF
ncbi:proteoglycan 4-like [Palaemon carinicauda]|uniref:proteoglycan 4-like n=1 Tax=Palaemon carinicauda TaxID=392227 RepID=UPI0035B66311